MNLSLNKVTESLKRLDQDASYSSYVALSNAISNVGIEESPWPILKVAVIRNFTIEPLLPILKGEILRMGFFPQFYIGDYDTIINEVMSAESGLYQFNPDVIILAQWLEALAPRFTQRFASFSREEVNLETERILKTIKSQIENIRKYCAAPVLINNFPIPYPTVGILDTSEFGQMNIMHSLNKELSVRMKPFLNVFFVDYEALMANIGYTQGFDERYWHAGKSPFSRHALIPVAKEYIRFIRALKGKTHKCLILDCDNTLWGGIIGEDGFDNIKLGPEYPGSCYMAFQNEVLNLHDRGIILALCSKNNEEDVLEVLEKHPYTVIRKEHLVTWRINWDDKVQNIRAIVEELNIGMDSVVFVDDNAYEIGLVKHQIPEITAIQLPLEPSQIRGELLKQGFFDSLSFSQEDKRRTQMYREEARRKQMAVQASSVKEYLKELEIQVEISSPQNFHIPRIAQLTQKTNQFNLTTRRYTEDNIRQFAEDSNWDVWYLQLQDKISDMGIVGVIMVRYDGIMGEIDSFLLSCRALGRGIENAFLIHVINSTQARGIKILKGEYIPTVKNKQAAEFYKKHGFTNSKDSMKWELNLKEYAGKMPEWIKVNSQVRSAV